MISEATISEANIKMQHCLNILHIYIKLTKGCTVYG